MRDFSASLFDFYHSLQTSCSLFPVQHQHILISSESRQIPAIKAAIAAVTKHELASELRTKTHRITISYAVAMSLDSVSRPETTEDLVRRLQDSKTDAKELIALKALASRMMSIFKDDKSYTHYYEAAAIAPFQDWLGYKNILITLIHAVCTGTADGLVPIPELCEQFVSVLRLRDRIEKDTNGNALPLGQVMDSLQKRLNDAVHRASPAEQYQMVDTLGRVLDAMKDAKTNGISREEHRDPLLKSLDGLRDSEEIRLSQAATYAYEALRGIPDDEGPYKAALRHAMTLVEAGAKIAGAVATMDPSKLISGIIDLTDVPDLVSSVITVIETLYKLSSGIRDVPQDLKLQNIPKTWYTSLRLADFYILNRRFSDLEEFIRNVQCRLDIDFLCGLYARLERAWITAGRAETGEKDQDQAVIQSIIEKIPSPKDHSDDLEHIHAWKQAVRKMIGREPTSEPPKRQTLYRRVKQRAKQKLNLKKKYSSQVQYTVPDNLTTPSGLLDQAWKSCPEAQLWYADVKLRDYYLLNGEERLQITRISGESLSMAQCYINLAIVEQDAEAENASSLKVTLADRLQVSDVPENRSVILGNLFEPRRCLDGRERAPRRLLIRGRAGVGKTTLCKKIVHSFTRQPVDAEFHTWTERYDRILWIPLRDLKRHEAHLDYGLAEFLKGGFFPRCSESAVFSTALGDHCSSDGTNSRTLFLLDGLDEVSDQLDSEHEMSGFLHWLLRRPDAIITSRPGGSHANTLVKLDCELETVGFNSGQVQTYISRNAKHADAMQALLSKRPLLLSLMRIPVQLDAFCYIWDDTQTEAHKENLSSMASIYRLIERRLWHKDIPRLRKTNGSRNHTEDSALGLAASEVDTLIRGENAFLGALAFAGLYHEVVNFGLQECDDVRATWGGPRLEGQLSETLSRLSFLRTSGSGSPHQRTYHFVHLTYQEYFAAQYLVSRWIEGEHLGSPESKFGKRGVVNLSPIAFLRQSKYRPRFNIFWRFVAGALSGRNNERNLVNFFDELEGQPRDILGLTHQRLVMHCLSEADPEHQMACFDQRREKLCEWAEWESKTRSLSLLVNEAEFPPLLYGTVLRNMDESVREKILKSVRGDSAARLQFMANEVANNTTSSSISIEFLREQPDLPLAVLDTLMSHSGNIFSSATANKLDDESQIEDLQQIIVAAIVSNLPNSITHSLRLLADEDESAVSLFADEFTWCYGTLQRSSGPSHATSLGDNEQLIGFLQHLECKVRFVAFVALLSQEPLPDSFLEALLSRLQDSEDGVVKETCLFLRDARFLPLKLQPAVLKCLYNANEEICTYAVEVLLPYSCSLSDSDLNVAIEVLGSASEDTKARVVDAIAVAGSRVPAGVINLLHTWLKDDSSAIRVSVLVILERQRLPSTVLETLSTLLRDDPDSSVRLKAAKVLENSKTPLPLEILSQLPLTLDDEDKLVAFGSLAALCSQDASGDVLTRAVTCLENSRLCKMLSGTKVFDLAATKLPDVLQYKFSTGTPGGALKAHIIKLWHLVQATSMPSETVRAIYEEYQHILAQLDNGATAERNKWFNESDEDIVLWQMSRILSQLATLPGDVQIRLLDQLHNGSTFASQVAAEALSHPLLLEPTVISGLVKLARKCASSGRFRALRNLSWKANLTAEDMCIYAETLRETIHGYNRRRVLEGISEDDYRGFLYFVFDTLHILPDEEASLTLGCNNAVFRYAIAQWLKEYRSNITLYSDPDHDTLYILNHPMGQKRIRKEVLPMSVEQCLEDMEVPKALGKE